MAADMDIPFLGKLPLDPRIGNRDNQYGALTPVPKPQLDDILSSPKRTIVIEDTSLWVSVIDKFY